jgi:TIR domain
MFTSEQLKKDDIYTRDKLRQIFSIRVLQRVAYVSTKNDAGTSNIKEVHEEDASHSYLVNKYKRDVEMKKASATMEQNKHLKLVYCYAREDRMLLEELDKHLRALKRQYEIVIWSDYEISPGMEWEKEIDARLNTANIILLLMSSDFMASDYCYGVEMKHALERHKRGEATVIPVILRPIEWQDTPIGKLQALPKNGKPVVDPE